MIERHYLTALYSFTAFGPARTKLLIDYFGSAKKAWSASEKKLKEIGLKVSTLKTFVKYRREFDLEEYFNKLKQLKIDFITVNDNNYPHNLLELDGAPLVLYIKGTIKPADINAVAIVGTRKMTSYGREVTTRFASGLASMGVTIVSGLAFGVDAAAHKACLEAGGRTFAVLPSGLDAITPASSEPAISRESFSRPVKTVLSKTPDSFAIA